MPSLTPFLGPAPAFVSNEKGWLSLLSSSGGCRDNSAAGDNTTGEVPCARPHDAPSPPPVKEQQNELPPLHVVTVTTHADGYFKSLAYSSLLLHSGLRVLGWGEKWKGFGMKEVKLVEYCRQVPPRDVVMLVDGFDTVLLQPNEVIVRKFLEFGGRVVLTGESRSKSFLATFFLMFHNCVFKSAAAKHWPKPLPYANKNMNVRLLNAGGMIGYAEDLIRLFKDFEPSWNDQRYLSEVFMKEPHKMVTIDANATIFSLYRSSCKRNHATDSVLQSRNCGVCGDESCACDLRILCRRFVTPPEADCVSVLVGDEVWSFLVCRKQFKYLTYAEAEKQARHVVPYFPDDAEWNEEAAQKRCPAPSFQRSALRGVLMDAITCETPCVLHMYCRRNADSVIKLLGLPKGEKVYNLFRLIWYAFFSLHGTLLTVSKGKIRWHTPYLITFLSAVVGGIGVLGVLINALVYLASLSVVRGTASHLQQRAGALLAPLLLPQVRCDAACGGEGRGQPTAHHSSWFIALQLILHLLLMQASCLSLPGSVLVYIAVSFFPVFVAFAVAGILVLGAFLHFRGGFGDEDEMPAPADSAPVGPPALKEKIR